eukprot:TRINITY_DN7777_c0_g1_i7.p1 TRINITY_DN7777_c0_g1~~TRINITY_DN7777_c0_g1_i7.p1  ORF type:complete len:568 (+),score=45.10 TRINITY_DN7777_c0_g1_i7:72-1706(+)
MNFMKWGLQSVDGFVSFLKQGSDTQVDLDSIDFDPNQIPNIPNNIIFSKLSGKYAACARLTCKSWKQLIDNNTTKLHPISFNPDCLVESFQNLVSLDLQLTKEVTDTNLRVLPQLRQLRQLNLKRCKEITDEGLHFVAQCTLLTYLNLGKCNGVGNQGVKAISLGCKNLENLNVKLVYKLDTGIEDICLNLTNLTYLNISGLQKVENHHLSNLSNLRNLQTLQVQNCDHVTSDILSVISNLRNLSSLEHSFGLTKELAQILREMNSIAFYGTKDDVAEWDGLQTLANIAMSKVNSLKLDNGRYHEIPPRFFELAKSLFEASTQLSNDSNQHVLTSLSLHGLSVGYEIFIRMGVTNFPQHIKNLKIVSPANDSGELASQVLTAIANRCPNLQHIQLCQESGQRQVLSSMLKIGNIPTWIPVFQFPHQVYNGFKNLKSIYLIGANVNDEDLKVLSQISILKLLRLELCIFQKGFQNIKEFVGVQYMSLKRSYISGTFSRYVIEAFHILKELCGLNLEGVENADLKKNRRSLLVNVPQGLQLQIDPY